MKCLVIEDDTARYLCNGLREAAYGVTACEDWLDGLHHAINERCADCACFLP
jgi:hypothetical protein